MTVCLSGRSNVITRPRSARTILMAARRHLGAIFEWWTDPQRVGRLKIALKLNTKLSSAVGLMRELLIWLT